MSTRTLYDVFLEQLRDLYATEKQAAWALTRVITRTSSPELRRVLEGHLDETRDEIDRLKQVFRLLDEKARAGTRRPGISRVLRKMRKDRLSDAVTGAVRDAALIGVIQRVEHYETAAYGTLAAWAAGLGHKEVATLLKESLGETKDVNWKLSRVAASSVNPAALSAGEDEVTLGGST
jgi:ferritin-like metal-binding protein YciE